MGTYKHEPASVLCPAVEEVFPGSTLVENPPASSGDGRDEGSIPGSGRTTGGGHRQHTPVFLPGDSQDRGAWWVTVHWVAESDTTEAT